MFCPNCGKQLKNDAKFCDACGTKVAGDGCIAQTAEKKETLRESKIFKCPYCGEILPYDAIKCPSCGKEIRGKEATSSLQSFFDKYTALDENDVDRKIDVIKSFPIPNSREDIIEFMFFASSNFDAKYYATNQKKDSVASAWLAKIDSCYQKGKSLLTDPHDLRQIEDVYKRAHGEVFKLSKARFTMIFSGIGIIIIGVLLICLIKNNQIINYVGAALLAIGIVAIVFGAKRKKTNKELEEEKAEKLKKQENKTLRKRNKK